MYNWEGIEFPAGPKDWKNLNEIIRQLLLILFVPHNTKTIRVAYQGIIQKKSASGSRTLPFAMFDKKCPFCQSCVILTYFCVISMYFWVKLHKKSPFLRIPNAGLKFQIILCI